MFPLLIVLAITCVQSTDYTFEVDVNTVISNIPTAFYGFTIDWWTANDPTYGKKWGNAGALTVDFSNANFIALTSAVSPSILRIGGSPEDSIIYNISGACLNVNKSLPGYGCSQTKNNYGCLNVTRWQAINTFATKTNATLLFGLSACYGRPTSNTSIDFSNIQGLLDATATLSDTQNLAGFEFGNELNSRISAYIYSKDFITLHGMIQNTLKSNTPYLVGADVGSSGYSQDIITNLQSMLGKEDVSSVLHRLTYHHYPNCKYPGTGSVFDLSCLESIHSDAVEYNKIAASGHTTAWMGEGSEHSGGGTTNVSNTFVDCFYYLYQLCDVLTYQIPGTMRSDLVGGDYELIDHKTFLPNPDYWILYLWKMFIGDKIYSSPLSPSGNFRSFAFNGKTANQIVIASINFDLKNSAQITWTIKGGASSYSSDEYHLKTVGNSLQSRVFSVNGVDMTYNGQFPKIQPVKGNGKSATLDPTTIAFFVLTPS